MSPKPNDDGRSADELRALRAERAAAELKSDRREVDYLDALIAAMMKDLPTRKETEALARWRMGRKKSSTSTPTTAYAKLRR